MGNNDLTNYLLRSALLEVVSDDTLRRFSELFHQGAQEAEIVVPSPLRCFAVCAYWTRQT